MRTVDEIKSELDKVEDNIDRLAENPAQWMALDLQLERHTKLTRELGEAQR